MPIQQIPQNRFFTMALIVSLNAETKSLTLASGIVPPTIERAD
ncbi:hypothetical protein QW180_29970 [Vibrio sinaloensis]|nr:hypothetical protein [Vibrio sinaloensis]